MKILRLPTILAFSLIFSTSIFSQKLVLDDTFAPALNGSVFWVEILEDQRILISGDFTTINERFAPKLALLNPNGSIDTAFNSNWIKVTANPNVAEIDAITVQSDGKILIAGKFAEKNFGDEPPNKLLRLNADGTFDSSLTTIPLIDDSNLDNNGFIRKIQPTLDGKILVCGRFDTVNGNSQSYLARYNNDGSYDPSLTTEFDDDCSDVEVQLDNKYLVSGDFTTINGDSIEGLARFNTDDTIDKSFDAWRVNNEFHDDRYDGIKLHQDGTIYAFQKFSIQGSLVRLNSDGSLRTKFLAHVRSQSRVPGDVEILPNGKVIAVGDYSPRTGTGQSDDINRFFPYGKHDGSVDKTRFLATDDYEPVYAVEISSDEKIIVGGSFDRILQGGNFIQRFYLIRLKPEAVPIQPKFDFDGDGRDDLSVYRPSTRIWYVNQSTSGFYATQFGISSDIPVAADYDRDGRADIAVFRDGVWYWLQSSDNTVKTGVTGQAGDIPQGGYFGTFGQSQGISNGTPGLLAFRPSEAAFYSHAPFRNPVMLNLGGMPITQNDIPVVADYDSDGKEDVAVFNEGNWFYNSSNDFLTWHYQFGTVEDKPVPADYDGDGITDYAVFRPSNRVWYIQKSTEGFYAVQWGLPDDLLVPADYDCDGKTDIAIYRDGIWFILHNDNSIRIEQFGLAGDVPAQLR